MPRGRGPTRSLQIRVHRNPDEGVRVLFECHRHKLGSVYVPPLAGPRVHDNTDLLVKAIGDINRLVQRAIDRIEAMGPTIESSGEEE